MTTSENYVRQLLKQQTARDKQKTIGPSLYGAPCAKCIADYLRTSKNEQGRFWLGAVIGTAVHHLLEERNTKGTPEQRVHIGHLEGYGDIDGSADLVWNGHVIDYKTTTRTKLKAIKRAYETEPSEHDFSSVLDARYKLMQYYGQMSQYGLGLTNMGVNIHTLSIVFVCRDGLTDEDIWGMDMPFVLEDAQKVWYRLERIWEAVQAGREDFDSHPQCYPCNN